MRVNSGFFVNKLIKKLYRPALRDCTIDRTAKIGMASNCIRVKMGRYSYAGFHNAMTDVQIGSFCSIASNCSIGGGKHQTGTVSTSPVFFAGRNILGKNFTHIAEDKNLSVEIGNDVWIGEAVFVCDGVKIGTGAVIGAHSVVTKDVPPYAVVAGAPARILRYRFDEETIQKLMASQWWEWPEEELDKMAEFFNNVEQFLIEVGKK